MRELNISLDAPKLDSIAFSTATEFSMFIETTAKSSGMTYLETIMEYCNQNNIDPPDIATKITKSLKSKLEIDYAELNYLPKQVKIDL